MNRDQIDGLVAEVMAEHFATLRGELVTHIDRTVAAKPVPPFVPPSPWMQGQHTAAGLVVRHRNGVFYARRDTDDEPPSDAWLPLLVGFQSVELRWTTDRIATMRVLLSDGTEVSIEREFPVPIVRGAWDADTDYRPGDRVFNGGEWEAVKANRGNDPNAPDAEGTWLKVGGKTRGATFRLDQDGTLFESGREIGSIKPLVRSLFNELVTAPR